MARAAAKTNIVFCRCCVTTALQSLIPTKISLPSRGRAIMRFYAPFIEISAPLRRAESTSLRDVRFPMKLNGMCVAECERRIIAGCRFFLESQGQVFLPAGIEVTEWEKPPSTKVCRPEPIK
jgi:hypothetical protein